MGRPTKENSLTRQDVVAAALACLDQDGEAGLGVNRVARALGIKPPAIYKHLEGNQGLLRAVALHIWRDYLAELAASQPTNPPSPDPKILLSLGAQVTRNFARAYPARFRVMSSYPMRPSDPEEAELIQASLGLLKTALQLDGLSSDVVIDVMRMVNAAIYGFIFKEQAELMTLPRSADASFEVMLEALMVGIEYIQKRDT
jgi:AcrR family transcriptional regulator